MSYSPSWRENTVETMPTRLRQMLSELLAESLRNPLPPHTPRRVSGRTRFAGKVTAVLGMRRAGKTTFLHQLRRECAPEGEAPFHAPYVSFEDDRFTGL